MASNTKRINYSELDFDQIKTNIKDYMRGQSKFSDYDFDGAGLSVLIDVLAYNTHYNALYTNFALNEMFLDSASKRESVVSLSKMLGYSPRSAKSARAYLNLYIAPISPTATLPTNVTLPKLQPFSSTIDGVTYTFYNLEEVTANYTGTRYEFNNLELVEGSPLSYRYEVAYGQKIIIPNQYADISTLKVQVQEASSSDKFTTFYPASSIVELESTSNVYYVKEIDNGLYEVYFGDGIVSSGVELGNVVHIDYFVSRMGSANGCRTFTFNGSTTLPSSRPNITLISPAAGGEAPETLDSIKYNAPRLYAAQNRAVTPDDFKSLIYSKYPNIASVAVWGGEDNDPPIYGKTFICVKPSNALALTSSQKTEIINTVLKTRSVVSITPELLDPEFINIAVNTTIYYNARETTKTSRELQTEVLNTIKKYNTDELQRFDGMMRFSKLSRLIDMCDPAIVSNITTIYLRRTIVPKYGISAEYKINLINPIYSEGVPEEAISSTGFYITGDSRIHYLEDDGVGNLVLFYHGSSETSATSGSYVNHIVVNPKIGTVDYASGKITISNLNISALVSGTEFELLIKPQSNDVISAYTQIAQIDENYITVNSIADKTSNGDNRAGTNFVFTSSRG
jgi:hypothetical protein